MPFGLGQPLGSSSWAIAADWTLRHYAPTFARLTLPHCSPDCLGCNPCEVQNLPKAHGRLHPPGPGGRSFQTKREPGRFRPGPRLGRRRERRTRVPGCWPVEVRKPLTPCRARGRRGATHLQPHARGQPACRLIPAHSGAGPLLPRRKGKAPPGAASCRGAAGWGYQNPVLKLIGIRALSFRL